MRTTIRLDDDLLARAKALAAKNRVSLNHVIEDAVRRSLAAQEQEAPAKPPGPLPVIDGRGLRAGVDLNRGAELLEYLEHETAVHETSAEGADRQ